MGTSPTQSSRFCCKRSRFRTKKVRQIQSLKFISYLINFRLSTAGHTGGKGSKLYFGNVFFSDGVKGSAIFFVLHPTKWRPYQHRFKTSSFTNAFKSTVKAIVASGVAVGVGAGIAAAAASGAAIGSFLPGPGTAAGAVLGAAVGAVIATLSDDYVGDYLRYIG